MSRINQLEQFLERLPNDAFLMHALALEYVKEENHEKALEYFQKNRKIHIDYIATYFHLGKLLEKMENPQEALMVYEEGMNISQKLGDPKTYNEIYLAKDFLEDELD